MRANTSTNEVSVLRGNGMGSFAARIGFPIGIAPNSVDVGDFNGDGFPDIVASTRLKDANGVSNVSVILGDGMGLFSPPTLFPVATLGPDEPALPAVRAADLNGDEIIDLAVINRSDSTVSILIGNSARPITALRPLFEWNSLALWIAKAGPHVRVR